VKPGANRIEDEEEDEEEEEDDDIPAIFGTSSS
jgi:hypothetical protein